MSLVRLVARKNEIYKVFAKESMPLINVRTSISSIEKPELLLQELSKELSDITGKPEKYVMALLETDVPMVFSGSNEPCCYIEIKSIGAINPSEMSAAFCRMVSSKTEIPSSRIYLRFEDIPAKYWGWDGRTFG